MFFTANNNGAAAMQTTKTPGHSAIVFTDIGTYLQTHGTIHIAINVDYRFFKDHCDLLQAPSTNASTNLFLTKASKIYQRTLARTISHACRDVDQLSVHPVAQFQRHPRQVWAAVMAVTSIFSLYEVTMLQRLTDKLQDKQHQQATLLRHQATRIDLLKIKNDEISGDMRVLLDAEQNITSNLNTISWLQGQISLVNEFGTDVNRAYEVMQELRRGRVSPLLLDKDEAKKLLARVQAEAKAIGGDPIIDHPEDLYQLPVSVVSNAPFVYDILVHIGVTKETHRLYRYHPSPIIMRQDGQQVALMIEPQRRLLVHSLNTHQELEENDLNGCQQRQSTYICPGPTAFHTQPRKSCLGSLFAGDLASTRENCPLRQTNITWTAQTLGSDEIAVYFRDRTTLMTICPGDVRRNIVVQGHQVLNVSSSCSITGLDLRINARSDILIKVPAATHPEWDTAELLDGRTPADILAIRARLQQHNVHPDPEIARLLQQEAADQREEEEDYHATHHHYAGYVLAAIVVVAAAAFLYRYGKLYAAAAKRTYIELRSIKTPPVHPED
jgi:hypothetical protein